MVRYVSNKCIPIGVLYILIIHLVNLFVTLLPFRDNLVSVAFYLNPLAYVYNQITFCNFFNDSLMIYQYFIKVRKFIVNQLKEITYSIEIKLRNNPILLINALENGNSFIQ